MKLYAEISKAQEQDDGTIKVWGYASTDTVDSEGEIITSAAMKAAMPDYLKFGAVREMHDGKRAAGTAIEMSVADDGKTFFGAHIVDTEAVKKVKAKVYKGFSIGGTIPKGGRDSLDPKIINKINLVEVSLVDRPANPEAIITLFKRDEPANIEDEAMKSAAETAAIDALAEMLNSKSITAADLVALAKAKTEAVAEPAVTTAATAATDKPDETVGKTVETVAVTETVAAVVAVVASESKAESLSKGLGTVSDLAYTLKSILYLLYNQCGECAREGDNSPVPQQLSDWLTQGTAVLQAMLTEEIAEVVAAASTAVSGSGSVAVQPPASASDYGVNMAYAERVVNLMKAEDRTALLIKVGSKFSAESKAILAQAHLSAYAIVDKLNALGYVDNPTEGIGSNNSAPGGRTLQTPGTGEDLRGLGTSVASAQQTGDLAKATAEAAATAEKLTKAEASLATANEALTKATAEIERLNAQPLPGKALLKALAKGEDIDSATVAVAKATGVEDAVETTLKGEQLAMHQLRKIFSSPGQPVR